MSLETCTHHWTMSTRFNDEQDLTQRPAARDICEAKSIGVWKLSIPDFVLEDRSFPTHRSRKPAMSSSSPQTPSNERSAQGTAIQPGQNEEVFSPQPGTPHMPPWTVGELPKAPTFHWTRLFLMVGPGLVMGGAAIGGGEWLTGPLVSARYGAALLWLATLSVFFQVIYNVEISRYTLYSGEPIFTGKFRIGPHPMFWVMLYLILDFGSILPYLASNAAIPLGAMILKHIPDPKVPAEASLLTWLSCGIFVSVFIPLCIGGKVYNSIKALMTFKLIFVLGFLLFIAFRYSTLDTWKEIGSGFFEFGNVPVVPAEDTNKNGKQDEGESAHGPNVDNVFLAWGQGRSVAFDLSLLGVLASMVAISGNGGLTNTPISSFTRDQGWGMGKHVGAIPSLVGGHEIELSHSGKVFRVTQEALQRWFGWMAHVSREQYLVWLPACFIGLALPSMLSVQFLPRPTVLADKWQAAAMTAGSVRDVVGQTWGQTFWYLTLFCGFLILGSSMVTTADGVLRRWVDVFWTASKRLQTWDPSHIGKLYFGVLCAYMVTGLMMLLLVRGDTLLVTATGMMYNYALGFSCLHTLVVNTTLLPRELRPRLWQRIGLVMGAIFFLAVGGMATYAELPKLKSEFDKLFGTPAAVANITERQQIR